MVAMWGNRETTNPRYVEANPWTNNSCVSLRLFVGAWRCCFKTRSGVNYGWHSFQGSFGALLSPRTAFGLPSTVKGAVEVGALAL